MSWDFCGPLQKERHIRYHNYWFGIRGCHLHYFDKEGDAKPKRIINLRGAIIQETSETAFVLKPAGKDDKEMKMKASDQMSKRQWISALNAGINNIQAPLTQTEPQSIPKTSSEYESQIADSPPSEPSTPISGAVQSEFSSPTTKSESYSKITSKEEEKPQEIKKEVIATSSEPIENKIQTEIKNETKIEETEKPKEVEKVTPQEPERAQEKPKVDVETHKSVVEEVKPKEPEPVETHPQVKIEDQISKNEPEALTRSLDDGPEPVHSDRGLDKVKPVDVVKEEPKPVIKEDPKPVIKEEPKPIIKEEPKPIIKEEPKPVIKEEPKPIVKEPEPKPVETKKEEPKPIVKEEITPLTHVPLPPVPLPPKPQEPPKPVEIKEEPKKTEEIKSPFVNLPPAPLPQMKPTEAPKTLSREIEKQPEKVVPQANLPPAPLPKNVPSTSPPSVKTDQPSSPKVNIPNATLPQRQVQIKNPEKARDAGMGRLIINGMSATGLRAADKNLFKANSSDPFIKAIMFSSRGPTEFLSKVIKKNLDPVWTDVFDFDVFEPCLKVKLEVYDWDGAGDHDFLGQYVLALPENDKEIDVDCPLVPSKIGQKVQGKLKFHFKYIAPTAKFTASQQSKRVADPQSFGRVIVKGLRASKLKAPTIGTCDPYVKVMLRSASGCQEKQTPMISDNINPEWHEWFTFNIYERGIDLLLEFYDSNVLGDELLGAVQVPIPDNDAEDVIDENLIAPGTTTTQAQGRVVLDYVVEYDEMAEWRGSWDRNAKPPELKVKPKFSWSVAKESAERLVKSMQPLLSISQGVTNLLQWKYPYLTLPTMLALLFVCWYSYFFQFGAILPMLLLTYTYIIRPRAVKPPIPGKLPPGAPTPPPKVASANPARASNALPTPVSPPPSKPKALRTMRAQSTRVKEVTPNEATEEEAPGLGWVTHLCFSLANAMDSVSDLITWKYEKRTRVFFILLIVLFIVTWFVKFHYLMFVGVLYMFTLEAIYARYPLFRQRFPLERLISMQLEWFKRILGVSRKQSAAGFKGEVKVTVNQARDLRDADKGGKSDPFAIVMIGGKKASTPVCKETLNPVWNSTLPPFTINKSVTQIVVQLWDHDGTWSKNDFLGEVVIQVAGTTGEVEDWYELAPRPGTNDANLFIKGQVQIKYSVTATGHKLPAASGAPPAQAASVTKTPVTAAKPPPKTS
eukprot:NODE_99_length_3768_cov_84.629355_g84_i0.p1 GENE.NODE_99_length_3768_cov_84.629355_g84_i0~~NODE_99_length_3768_cov_84.629355_g84_i0.p1  ORF type:complete len:1190 (-),score=318.19 NODE_99_length_3768_cov_84.629355_g84_i0:160-3729(-)